MCFNTIFTQSLACTLRYRLDRRRALHIIVHFTVDLRNGRSLASPSAAHSQEELASEANLNHRRYLTDWGNSSENTAIDGRKQSLIATGEPVKHFKQYNIACQPNTTILDINFWYIIEVSCSIQSVKSRGEQISPGLSDTCCGSITK